MISVTSDGESLRGFLQTSVAHGLGNNMRVAQTPSSNKAAVPQLEVSILRVSFPTPGTYQNCCEADSVANSGWRNSRYRK
jgi:hypothetical protein